MRDRTGRSALTRFYVAAFLAVECGLPPHPVFAADNGSAESLHSGLRESLAQPFPNLGANKELGRDGQFSVAPKSGAADTGTVDITGEGDAITLTADSTLQEAIEKFASAQNFDFYSDKILDAKLSGSYHGSVESILAELLQDESYIVNIVKSRRSVQVLSGAQTKQDTRPTPTAANTRPAFPAPVVLTPAARQELVKKLFGDEARTVKISDQFLAAYALRAMRGADGHGGRAH